MCLTPALWVAAHRRDASFRDPRRVFWEISAITTSYIKYGVLTSADYCRFQWYSARSWLQRKLEGGVRLRPPSASHYVD